MVLTGHIHTSMYCDFSSECSNLSGTAAVSMAKFPSIHLTDPHPSFEASFIWGDSTPAPEISNPSNSSSSLTQAVLECSQAVCQAPLGILMGENSLILVLHMSGWVTFTPYLFSSFPSFEAVPGTRRGENKVCHKPLPVLLWGQNYSNVAFR